MTRVLITNAYSARNRGDAAIILGMIESLRSTAEFADAEIVVSSADYPDDRLRYPVPVVPSFHSMMDAFRGSARLRCLFFLLVVAPFSVLAALHWRRWRRELPAPKGVRSLLREYAASDLIVAAGGGYLYTTSRLNGNVMLLIHLHSFLIGHLMGKPVYLFAQSVGPFAAGFQERLVRAALKRVRLFEARESWSAQWMARGGSSPAVATVADAAFLLEASTPTGGLAPTTDALRVGMTVRRWFRDPDRQREYEQEMAEFVTRLLANHDAEVVFVPQVTVGRGDDDRQVARRVLGEAGEPAAARLLDRDYDPGEIQWICSRMDFFVGTRMHSNIFALSSGVPALAIAYQPKTTGIMQQLGLEEFVIAIEELTADRLESAFTLLKERGPALREHLRQVLPTVRDGARRAGRLIAEDFAALRDPHRPGDGA